MASKKNTPAKAKNVVKDSVRVFGDEKKKKEIYTFKYFDKLEQNLYEAAIFLGEPVFVYYDREKGAIRTVESIEEASRIIRPIETTSYPYTPYEFTNAELQALLKQARFEDTGSLFKKTRLLVEKFNDQDPHKTALLSGDIVWSYFQDKFSTCHYLDIVGDNGSGKSTMGETYAALAFRVVNITDPTAPNYFRVFGSLEPGQCTIVADESETIDKVPELMGFLKAGYDVNGRVSRINPNTNKPEYFFAYGQKVIIAERSPDQWKAKGVMDRTFVLHCYRGQPEYDIKEILAPAGNRRRQKMLDELMHLRKLMLVFRLMHYNDPIVDLDIGVKGRDKELCKAVLQLFHGMTAQQDLIAALQRLLDEKNERKQNTLEPVLYPIIRDLIEKRGSEVQVYEVWQGVRSNVPGVHDDKKPGQYETTEYGTLYYNTITRLMVDKFGAKSKRKNDGAVLVFSKDKLERFARAYANGNASKIKVSVIEDDPEPDDVDVEKKFWRVSGDGSEGSAASKSSGSGVAKNSV